MILKVAIEIIELSVREACDKADYGVDEDELSEAWELLKSEFSLRPFESDKAAQ